MKKNELMQEAKHSGEELIFVITQAFYGNRTGVEIRPSEMDALILGYTDGRLHEWNKVDRTIIRLPGAEHTVLVYNAYAEEERLTEKEEAWQERQYRLKPLAVIPEMNLEIYSRCILCRMDEQGNFHSLETEDREYVVKYLSE